LRAASNGGRAYVVLWAVGTMAAAARHNTMNTAAASALTARMCTEIQPRRRRATKHKADRKEGRRGCTSASSSATREGGGARSQQPARLDAHALALACACAVVCGVDALGLGWMQTNHIEKSLSKARRHSKRAEISISRDLGGALELGQPTRIISKEAQKGGCWGLASNQIKKSHAAHKGHILILFPTKLLPLHRPASLLPWLECPPNQNNNAPNRRRLATSTRPACLLVRRRLVEAAARHTHTQTMLEPQPPSPLPPLQRGLQDNDEEHQQQQQEKEQPGVFTISASSSTNGSSARPSSLGSSGASGGAGGSNGLLLRGVRADVCDMQAKAFLLLHYEPIPLITQQPQPNPTHYRPTSPAPSAPSSSPT
jgi:hypothetical protein